MDSTDAAIDSEEPASVSVSGSTDDAAGAPLRQDRPPSLRAAGAKVLQLLKAGGSFSSNRVAPENRMGRRIEPHEVEAATVALLLQLGLGCRSVDDHDAACHAIVAGAADPPRIVALPPAALASGGDDNTTCARGRGTALAATCVVELAPVLFAKARAAFGVPSRVYHATLAHPHAGGEGVPEGASPRPLLPRQFLVVVKMQDAHPLTSASQHNARHL